MENVEKDYSQQSLIASIAIHCLLLLICLLFVLRTPIPPYGAGMGVELNYGTVDEGYGDVQTLNKANPSPIKEEAAPAKEEEKKEEVPQKEVEEDEEEVKETPPARPEKVVEEKVITTDDEESKTYVKKTEEKAKPTTSVVTPDKGESEKKAEPAKKPKVDNRAVFGSSATSNGTAGSKEQTAGNSNGDRPGKVGDQGDPRGTLDAKALYGNPGTGGDGPGGSGGTGLNMSGWKWATTPTFNDGTSETGKIVFQLKVDSEGIIVDIRAIEYTVSPSVVQYYTREIKKYNLTKTSSGSAPPISSGRYTVVLKNN